MSDRDSIISLFGTNNQQIKVGDIAIIKESLQLDSGSVISDFPIAYRTYGELNQDKSNVILICHALTGDQYVAEKHPVTGKNGWWEEMVGKDLPIDISKYFIICPNILGGCMGSYSPKSVKNGRAIALDFPIITINDMVRSQELLLKYLKIDKIFAAIGGSMGGMQVLAWTAIFPSKVKNAIAIATAARHSTQNIAFNEIGRQAIMADPAWCCGNYIEMKKYPAKGLAVARMTAHVTYLSENVMQSKFGRKLQDRENITYGFGADFQIESYLRHQGKSFVERFDANSYLYITRAMDYFALGEKDKDLTKIYANSKTRFCIISFSSDWLFPPSEGKHIVNALNAAGADVSFAEIKTDKGHDAFLLNITPLKEIVSGFLKKG